LEVYTTLNPKPKPQTPNPKSAKVRVFATLTLDSHYFVAIVDGIVADSWEMARGRGGAPRIPLSPLSPLSTA
jgi:hypothetical protein